MCNYAHADQCNGKIGKTRSPYIGSIGYFAFRIICYKMNAVCIGEGRYGVDTVCCFDFTVFVIFLDWHSF